MVVLTHLTVKDIRLPTSQFAYGSDAMHTDPDYSCAYVIIETDSNLKGFGLTFTLGRGTEIVVAAIKALTEIVIGQKTEKIFNNFGEFWRKLTNDTQLRWLGPEKGVIHLAAAAILNALWDLWSRIENKPIWKLLTDMEPELLASTIDYRYISDVLTKEEVVEILREKIEGKSKREKLMKESGYPGYVTLGWLGYTDELIEELCNKYLNEGYRGFKLKVGQSIENDVRRCSLIRKIIGKDNYLMIDANQKWDINEAINWTSSLSEYKPLWIEEPTSPDDILGHAKISKALESDGIGVATGEVCSNRVMFKQMLQAKAMQYCQIDSCRLASINEILSVYFMAYKFKVPVCPHAGGIGLCEMVQHLQVFDYICISGTISPGQMIEYVHQQHHHFKTNIKMENGNYIPPQEAGYSTELTNETIDKYEFPSGQAWQQLL